MRETTKVHKWSTSWVSYIIMAITQKHMWHSGLSPSASVMLSFVLQYLLYMQALLD